MDKFPLSRHLPPPGACLLPTAALPAYYGGDRADEQKGCSLLMSGRTLRTTSAKTLRTPHWSYPPSQRAGLPAHATFWIAGRWRTVTRARLPRAEQARRTAAAAPRGNTALPVGTCPSEAFQRRENAQKAMSTDRELASGRADRPQFVQLPAVRLS